MKNNKHNKQERKESVKDKVKEQGKQNIVVGLSCKTCAQSCWKFNMQYYTSEHKLKERIPEGDRNIFNVTNFIFFFKCSQ